ncbi:hypothetical protein GQ53DRAFT_355367 [Thozetella sp. PMI_491]|nr:hypothetical protein GQ53DRAFT_355367 [Thozetella sp. PMI_491]
MDNDTTLGITRGSGGVSCQPSQNDQVSFHSLPWEVFMQIIGHLDYRTVLSLSEVNTSFHRSIVPNALVTKKVLNDFLMEVEHFKRYPRHLACFSCIRILPREDFARSMRYGKKGKNGIRESKRVTRCCWECAAQKLIYPQDMRVRKGKYVYYLCHTCGQFKLQSEKCLPTGCTTSEPAPQSRFETLPDDLQQRIFGMLEYGDALQLTRVNRHFAKAVDPQACDVRSKFLFMQRVGRRIKNHPRNYPASMGCYGCFTFKPMKKVGRPSLPLCSVQCAVRSVQVASEMLTWPHT